MNALDKNLDQVEKFSKYYKVTKLYHIKILRKWILELGQLFRQKRILN